MGHLNELMDLSLTLTCRKKDQIILIRSTDRAWDCMSHLLVNRLVFLTA